MLTFSYKTKITLFIKYFIFFFLVIGCAYEALYITIQYNNNAQKRIDSQEEEALIVDNEKNMIVNKVNSVFSDLLYLSDSVDVNSIELDGSFKTALQWTAFLDRKKIYDKICFYGTDGTAIETIYSKSGSYISDSEIPDENDKDLLMNTSQLQRGQVYISKIMANTNTNSEQNQQASGALIQFATPLYNSDGSQKGIVVADYYVKDMLDNFVQLSGTSNGTVYLLDADGFSISGSESLDIPQSFQRPDDLTVESLPSSESQSTASLQPPDNQSTESLPPDALRSALPQSDTQGDSFGFGFGSTYPNAWEYISNNLNGSINVDKGYFTFSHVLLYSQSSGQINGVDVVMDTGDWVTIAAIDINRENGLIYETNVFSLMSRLLPGQLFYFALILAISIIIAGLFVKNKLSKDAIKYFSEYDDMTNSLNRRAGFYKLRELRNGLLKYPRKLSICYIDIDDLKQVNDVYGHEAGDELIKTVVAGIQKNIRQSDYMIRLGGDEFLMVLMDSGEKEAEEIWQRIKSEFDTVNLKENRSYIVSASHGIEECIVTESCNIDSIIQKADQKMYKEKSIKKKSLKVIKEKI